MMVILGRTACEFQYDVAALMTSTSTLDMLELHSLVWEGGIPELRALAVLAGAFVAAEVDSTDCAFVMVVDEASMFPSESGMLELDAPGSKRYVLEPLAPDTLTSVVTPLALNLVGCKLGPAVIDEARFDLEISVGDASVLLPPSKLLEVADPDPRSGSLEVEESSTTSPTSELLTLSSDVPKVVPLDTMGEVLKSLVLAVTMGPFSVYVGLILTFGVLKPGEAVAVKLSVRLPVPVAMSCILEVLFSNEVGNLMNMQRLLVATAADGVR